MPGRNILNRTINQACKWRNISVIVPILSLVTIIVWHYIGFDTYSAILYAGLVILLALICIVWWFWAINSIVKLAFALKKTEFKFSIVKQEFQKIKKDLIDNNEDT